MPGPRGGSESEGTDRPSHQVEESAVSQLDVIVAVVGALALGWIADLMTGRRGVAGTTLVSAVGAVCGWFLATRVFAVSSMDQFGWVWWALAGSVICLVAFFLFRSKR